MTKRKTPYKHPVSAHTRSGKPITNYVRGKGDKPTKSRRSRVVGESPLSSEFDVTVSYISTSEKIPVEAKNYIIAFGRGVELREKTEDPVRVKIRMVK